MTLKRAATTLAPIRTVRISDVTISVTEDVIAGVLAFHARQRDRDPAAPPAAGYRPESLRILFGEGAS